MSTPNKNKYSKGTHILEHKFRQLIKYFLLDLNTYETSKITNISYTTCKKLFQQLRIYIYRNLLENEMDVGMSLAIIAVIDGFDTFTCFWVVQQILLHLFLSSLINPSVFNILSNWYRIIYTPNLYVVSLMSMVLNLFGVLQKEG